MTRYLLRGPFDWRSRGTSLPGVRGGTKEVTGEVHHRVWRKSVRRRSQAAGDLVLDLVEGSTVPPIRSIPEAVKLSAAIWQSSGLRDEHVDGGPFT